MRYLMLACALALAPVGAASAQVRDTTRRDTTLSEQRLPSEVAREVTDVYNAPATTRATSAMEIAADREVAGDVAVLHGPLTIAGHVTGKVVAINADIVFKPGARVDGDILVVGGSISGKENATIGGDVRIYQQSLAVHREGDRLTPREGGSPGEDENRWWRHRMRRPFGWSNITLASAHSYNRVEGLPIVVGPTVGVERPWGRLSVAALGIVRTAGNFRFEPENLGHTVKTELQLGRLKGVTFGGRLFDVVDAVETWDLTDTEVGLASFFLHRDYRDYFNRHGGTASVSAFLGRDLDMTVSYSDQSWGARREHDPFTLFRNGEDWRPNPTLDVGRFHVASTTLRLDTRNSRNNPWSGWYIVVDVEHGVGNISIPGTTSPGVRDVAGGPTRYDRGIIDLRRYTRISPDGQLNVRLVTGGWLGGDPLPLERRLSVGGPGTLPGFDFRRATNGTDVGTCSTSSVPVGVPAQCDRIALAQVEYRGDLSFDFLSHLEGGGDDDWHNGFDAHSVWVVFADAGRGWLVGPRSGDLRYPSSSMPSLGTYRTDVGAGLELEFIGLYLAKAVSESGQPVNFFVRVRRRF